MINNYVPPSRTDRAAHRDHVHRLKREVHTDNSGTYRYVCIQCGARLKRLNGVLMPTQEAKND